MNEAAKDFWRTGDYEKNYRILGQVAQLRDAGVDVERALASVLEIVKNLKKRGIKPEMIQSRLEAALSERDYQSF